MPHLQPFRLLCAAAKVGERDGEKRERENEKDIERVGGREGEQEQERDYARARVHVQEEVAEKEREMICMRAYTCVFGSCCAADLPAGP